MRASYRTVWLCLLVGLATLASPRAAAPTEPFYVNTYASDWGLWARGHALRSETAESFRFEIEELTLEPNRNYPQTYEISGFRLAFTYRDKTTGDLAKAAGATGPRRGPFLKLFPNSKKAVADLALEVPKGRPPRAGETLVLELHIMTGNGGYLALEVGTIDGRSADADEAGQDCSICTRRHRRLTKPKNDGQD